MVVENYLFSAAGGFLLGAISGYALKRIIRIVTVIIGTLKFVIVVKGLTDQMHSSASSVIS